MLGDPQGAVQSGVSNVLQGLCPTGETAEQCLQSGIQSVCPANQTDNCTAAITAYQTIGPSASSALVAFSSGNTISGIEDCLPLIGMAVSVSPAGPVAGAVVVGALSLGIDVLQALGLFNANPAPNASCNYVIWPIIPYWGNYPQDGVCFNNPVQPPGPVDPNGNKFPGWLTMEQFMIGSSAQLGPQKATWSSVTGQLKQDPDQTGGTFTWADVAFGSSIGADANYDWWGGLYSSLLACGVSMIVQQGQPAPAVPPMTAQSVAPLINPTSFHDMLTGTSPDASTATAGMTSSYKGTAEDLSLAIGGFVSAYCQTFFRAVLERIINNHNPVDPIVLLESCAQAWNQAHEPTAVYVFGTGSAGILPYNFVEAVIQGFVVLPPPQFGQTPQGHGSWAQGINVGPLKAAYKKSAPGQGGSGGAGATPAATSSSSAATALLVVGGLAALGAGGTYLYGRSHGMTFGQTVRSGWDRIRHPRGGGSRRLPARKARS